MIIEIAPNPPIIIAMNVEETFFSFLYKNNAIKEVNDNKIAKLIKFPQIGTPKSIPTVSRSKKVGNPIRKYINNGFLPNACKYRISQFKIRSKIPNKRIWLHVTPIAINIYDNETWCLDASHSGMNEITMPITRFNSKNNEKFRNLTKSELFEVII